MHCPSPRPRHPTCPTVTRAPRLDAIVAPENSFLKPSVDRGQARPWGTAHTPSPPRSPLPHPSPASHVKHCVSQQYICQAHGNGVPSGQLHPLPLLLIPPACSSSFIPAAPRQRLSQRCGRAAMPCAIARCCSDALSPTGPWLPRPLPSPLLSHRSPPQHSCRAGSPPLQPMQPHLPAGRGTCHPGHGNSCKEQEGEMSGAEIPPRAAPPPALPPPSPAAPTPHSLPPQVGRLLDIVLHPARQSRGVSRLYGWLWWGRHLSPCSTELGSAQGCSSFPKDKQQPSRALLGAVPPERLLSFQSWRSPPEPAVIAGGQGRRGIGKRENSTAAQAELT